MLMGAIRRDVLVQAKDVELPGTLVVPSDATGLVVFAHGSGSSRLSPRNALVADRLHDRGVGTLLFDLLTPAEDTDYSTRFDIPLLAQRLLDATSWLRQEPGMDAGGLGFFGASTGAAAALVAAASLGDQVSAVVSRGGRPDLAGDALPQVKAPTLLLVGGFDHEVIELNREAQARMTAPTELRIIPGATHLFEEAGTLEQVGEEAGAWFERYL